MRKEIITTIQKYTNEILQELELVSSEIRELQAQKNVLEDAIAEQKIILQD